MTAPGPSHADLVAHALGALPPAEAGALEARRRADPGLDARAAEVEAHLRRYEALRPGPPPPSLSRLFERIDALPRPRPRLRRLAYAATAAAGLVAAAWVGTAFFVRAPVDPRARIRVVATEPGTVFLPSGHGMVRLEDLLEDARAGDRLHTDDPAGLLLGERARLRLGSFSAVTLASEEEVALEWGTLDVDVGPAAKATPTAEGRRFRALASDVTVEVTGTRFALERPAPGAAPDPRGPFDVAVDVLRGKVLANGVPVSAGEQVLFRGGTPVPPGATARAPVLALAPADDRREAGKPLRLLLTLSNPSAAELPLPSPGEARAPYYVEVIDPTGATTPVRVGTESVEGDFPRALAPRGSARTTLRFDATFARAGAYRLRTLFLGRPAGAFPPRGPDLEIVLR